MPLDQAGRRTTFYNDDGYWHHVVFRKLPPLASKSIWLDGEAPDGFVSSCAMPLAPSFLSRKLAARHSRLICSRHPTAQ